MTVGDGRLSEHSFISPAPQVTILTMLDRPYETAVAAARTCYSSQGIVTTDDVAAGSEATRDRIARPISVAALCAACPGG